MIADMGVKPRDRSQIRTPRQKLRTAISAVQATVRMQKMVRDWKSTKKLGEGLKRAKDEVLRKRGSSISSKLALSWRKWSTVVLLALVYNILVPCYFLRILLFVGDQSSLDWWLVDYCDSPFIYSFACMAVLSFLQGVIGLDGELGRTLRLLSSFAYIAS